MYPADLSQPAGTAPIPVAGAGAPAQPGRQSRSSAGRRAPSPSITEAAAQDGVARTPILLGCRTGRGTRVDLHAGRNRVAGLFAVFMNERATRPWPRRAAACGSYVTMTLASDN